VHPPLHDLARIVELHAAVVAAGPQVEQLVAELRVPDQRRQILDRDRHAHVVDRAVGQRLDGAVRAGPATEQPQIAGTGLLERLLQ